MVINGSDHRGLKEKQYRKELKGHYPIKWSVNGIAVTPHNLHPQNFPYFELFYDLDYKRRLYYLLRFVLNASVIKLY